MEDFVITMEDFVLIMKNSTLSKELRTKFMILEEMNEILIPGGRMELQKKYLQPGKITAVLIGGTEEKLYSGGC
ncbi:MAG: hypothetical protein EZS28_042020 [Streblomastix strix]|uniref:Uncharacterized protein n=1 Tax=Streblomastix strix TaxID=222440 RepID=A0A5J4TW10_9EUKA|nr:MAG: hypothetical protein EZS28_042020 [Streblomastix strix]